ncbi:hypothetical protein Tco_0502934 [Tanacetum coccineum]
MKKDIRIYNRRTRRIIETIHVDFDELTAMASETTVRTRLKEYDSFHLHVPRPYVVYQAPEVIAHYSEGVAPDLAFVSNWLTFLKLQLIQEAHHQVTLIQTQDTQNSYYMSHDVEEDTLILKVALMISESLEASLNQSKYALVSLKNILALNLVTQGDTPMHLLDADHAGGGKVLRYQYGEVEYIALSGCCAQVLWMRSQLTDYGLGFNKIPMYCDNNVCVCVAYAAVQQRSTFQFQRHIESVSYSSSEHVENDVISRTYLSNRISIGGPSSLKLLARKN